MKILFINTVYGKGSTGRIVRDIGEAAEKLGNVYTAAYGRGNVSVSDAHAWRIGGRAGTVLHAGLARMTDRAGFYSAGATEKFIGFIRRFAPDIIHLHNLHGYCINIEILFGYLKNEYKGKVIWTLHDCWAYTGHCTHYDYAGCYKWKTLECGNCPQKKYYPKSVLLDQSCRNINDKKKIISGVPNMTVTAVSDWLLNEAANSFLNQYPLRRIYNGIDLSVFQPVKENIKEKYGIGGKFLILCVSDGWIPNKGLAHVTALSDRIKGTDMALMMIGVQKALFKKLPSNIIALEKTDSQTELAEFYTAADVFVNPSYEETFGMVSVEALACGTPCIVFDSAACPEIISGECGTAVERGNDGALAEAVEYYYRLRRNKNSPACRKRACGFSKEASVNEYLNLYYEDFRA